MRNVFAALLLLALAACTGSEQDFSEADIADLQDQMQRGELSSEELVSWYLVRIETVDRAGPSLNSIIEINGPIIRINGPVNSRAPDPEDQKVPVLMRQINLQENNN